MVKRVLNLNLNVSKKTESSQQQYLSISSSTFCSTLSLARLASISRYYFIVSLLLFAFLSKRNRAPCNSVLLLLLFSHLNLGAWAGFALANCDWLGRTIAFHQVFFQQGRVALDKWCIGPQKGRLRTPGMNFFLYSSQASFSWPRVDLARLLRRAYSWSVWIISFEFVKVCGIRFSIWESFIGFYIRCYPFSTILAGLFSVGVRILWKKLCWMRACRRKWHLVFLTLYIITVDKVNLNKLLQIIMKLGWSNKDNNN